MRIAVIGMGKIGLPLAAQYADRGHQVVGVDVNADVVALINAGQEPFPGEAHLAEHLARLVPTGALVATTDYAAAIPEADAVVVVVPLLVDGEGRPNFVAMDSATSDIGRHLTSDTLVIYETTLPVGTTRTRWLPALETGSGLVQGRDFHLVYSPERVLTGRVFADLRKYPKLIGALGEEGARVARDFYESVLEFDERSDLARANGVWDLGAPEAAELAKLAETTYRDVNIGLANQFAVFAESAGIDIHRVIEAANSQPYSHIHRPGIAVGGHCIPVYPRLYLSTDPDASIVRTAREFNATMPEHTIGLLAQAYGDLTDARVVVLGAAYRGGVKETAVSGVFDTVDALIKRGAVPLVQDPLFSADELRKLGLDPWDGQSPVDAVVVQADHRAYADLDSAGFPGVRVVVDGRRVLDPSRWSGTTFIQLGVSTT
ncbi:nucleotide sugar dehydrogenase [Nocardioides sp. Root1257]|uniref:nucleotide sugar dehydrogenase n=1 Tax=unclassified Nocardioides TaxID=2615069 RepID=UPI0006FD45BB|nr:MULTISPECIES: nucleotide sugar dehydrogenase [unclassified Nocardioides]KQW47808.1 nucleotide sugar dehydrogenase [Nocardioides sp. Root1257]KRC45060.1 nucleotide sugar dehydrogenase [Nocardioides sp. Root224]